jgi:hypothetical protein
MSNDKLSGKCPHCSSTNLSTEPVYLDEEDYWEYDYGHADEDEGQEIAVFCVTCGHYMGTISSDLRGKSSHADFIRQLYLKSPK